MAKKASKKTNKQPAMVQKPIVLPIGLVIGLALVAGFVGGYTSLYVDGYYNIVDRPAVTAPTEPEPEVITVVEKNPSNKDDKTVDQKRQSIVSIYTKKAEGSSLIDSIYTQKDLISTATVLTSDGWLITQLDKAPTDFETLVAFSSKDKAYNVERIVKDPVFGFTYIKIDAKDLVAMNLLNQRDFELDQVVYNFDSAGNLESSMIANKAQSDDVIVSSDESYTYATLAEEKPAGTALITQAGDLYGIVREDTQVIPMQHIAPLLKDIFTGNEITRTRLGVHMIDLSLIDASWDEGQLQHVKTGALIIGDAKRPAIKKDSAAAKAGLQEGDVIKRVEKTDVNEDHRLPQILAEYAPGTQVTITILRDSIEQEVEVTLQ